MAVESRFSKVSLLTVAAYKRAGMKRGGICESLSAWLRNVIGESKLIGQRSEVATVGLTKQERRSLMIPGHRSLINYLIRNTLVSQRAYARQECDNH